MESINFQLYNNPYHQYPLFIIANQIDQPYFEQQFNHSHVDNWGRPDNPIRWIIGLHYLKYSFNELDETVLDRFLENPYWQYFYGFEHFQHDVSIDAKGIKIRKPLAVFLFC